MYGGTSVTAVDHLCLGIPRGECFGLLGINGKRNLKSRLRSLAVFKHFEDARKAEEPR